MSASEDVLSLLADGRFHSGEDLARVLGVSRSAVWKQIQRLQANLGLDINAVRGRGYRLSAPLELLDPAVIRVELDEMAAECLERLTVLQSAASTNSCASADPPQAVGRARVWLAEHQTEGRGRRGRRWVSTFGENIYLSLAWRFELPMSELGGLSLVAGLVVAEALSQSGVEGHSLKWPNDVMIDERKLAGILVEVSGEAGGPSTAVVGVGVNLRIPEPAGAEIDQPWTDLTQLDNAPRISRNRLAGALVDQLIQACRLFAGAGLSPFIDRWDGFDGLNGQRVRVIRGQHSNEGVYRVITATGAMVLEENAERREYHAGEVSLRREEAE